MSVLSLSIFYEFVNFNDKIIFFLIY